MDEQFDAHDALADVQALLHVIEKASITNPTIVKEAHTLDSAVAHLQFLTNRARLFNGLREKLCRKDRCSANQWQPR